ncbi:hypothetical protein CDL12_19450 [Handroanthus impetiginosus]|uniref:Endonuclease/exonuclease/phosphatase domain-containing protein n=1 Tax=Handroanthus impetiginosus TaxID=429701 RepID=A0A2G9GRV0_9LAMI|nr:hypothetical protein CDL12_19450 [Handroanthus impetiginosus]
MQSRNLSSKFSCRNHVSYILRLFIWHRPRPKLIIRKLKSRKKVSKLDQNRALIQRSIRLATFNTALFSLAPAVPKAEQSAILLHDRPKGILKQSPVHQTVNLSENDNRLARSKPKVSINLPENEISLAQMRSPIYFSAFDGMSLYGSRTILDVLKEVEADVLALQDVKAEEEKDMRPFWAPEYGNAVLSKYPIKKWKVQKICDDRDFRNVIKATIDVPRTGELNVYSTQLDHLDENWRMKQINAMMQSKDQPHILAGGLNSLDTSDYSFERWNNIVKYYEELGKPTPKVEVTNFLKGRGYTDAKEFPGECEPVVMIAKGQNVQGTCKYGTRVDYILGSPGSGYKFVPGSYSVISSKGTSDHHIVKVDIVKVANGDRKSKRYKKVKQRVVRISNSCSSRGIWEISS